MIPEVTREQILAALEQFDREQRDTPEWASWEERGIYRYALVHKGRHYPVKQVIALAIGGTTHGFSGGAEANGYVGHRGFMVIPLRRTLIPYIWWVNGEKFCATSRAGEGIRTSPRAQDRGGSMYGRVI
jgi:hypothetical protein